MTDLETSLLPPANLANLPTGTIVICATLRLAQTLSHAHDKDACQDSGWRTLQACTLGQWLNQLYDALSLRGIAPAGLNSLHILNNFQEQLLWEKIIRSQIDTSIEALFDIQALAASAAQAHKLCIEWNIPVDGSEAGSEEQRQFQRWQSVFRAQCQQQQFADIPSLHARLVDHISNIDKSLLPSHICFAGFDHYSGLEHRLLTQLKSRDINCVTLAQNIVAGQVTRVIPTDLTQECLAIAGWAKRHLTNNPQAKLGIVVPDLESYQRPLQDALEDLLTPEHIYAFNAHQPRPFNISLGQPLSNTPIAHCALTLLQLISTRGDIEQNRIASLLHSPYWSEANDTEESDARARLDAAYRVSVALKAPLTRYESFASWYLDEHKLLAPNLRQHLQALAHATKDAQSTKLPSEWRIRIGILLTKTGWLAEGKLNSIEFQTQDAFWDTLEDLSKLDRLLGKISFQEAITRLNQLCSERLFQPKTLGNPAIQILGVLEATGQYFDALWFAGLTEGNWPPAAHPNPLIPINAQRRQSAPNCCAKVQLDFAQRIQYRLFRSAPEVVVSAPHMDSDTELQPSALITDIPAVELAPLEAPSWMLTADNSNETRLELVVDAMAPAIEPGSHVRGGTWLLRAQAICPAWGYFQYRLGAVPLQKPADGLDARDRGTLVHDALDIFWANIQNSNNLNDLLGNGLSEAINQSIDKALDAYNANKKHEPLKTRQRILESNRLYRLLEKWLRMEAERPESFEVIHREHEFQDNIGGIEVRMFIDRIDQLPDGRLLIIDYKTGASVDTRSWSSARLTEPQLPIYASIAKPKEGDVAGVAFGLVHLNKLAFKGIGDSENLIPGVDDLRSYRVRRLFNSEKFPDWQSVLAHWKTAIYAVADEICQGDASIRYTNENDLIFCDVLPLLRLAERNSQLQEALTATAPFKVDQS